MNGTIDIAEKLQAMGVPVRSGVVRPTSEAELERALTGLREAQARVGWVGAQSQGHAWTDPSRYDVSLTLLDMPQEVHLDAGEGVVRATAGVRWGELRERAAAQGLWLSPDLGVHVQATVGGVVSAGLSGADRDHYGALRHQVLATRVVLSDGRRAPFGAPLVKNVTGFNVPALMVGQRGRLAGLLDVALRLWPAPAERLAWSVPGPEGSKAWQRLRAARIPYLSVRMSSDPEEPTVLLGQGTAGAMADVAHRVRTELGAHPIDAAAHDQAWSQSWRLDPEARSVFVQGSPTAFPEIWRTLHQENLPWAQRLHWLAMPEIAEVRGVWVEEPTDAAREALAQHLRNLPCRWRFLGAGEPRPLAGGPESAAGLRDAQNALRHTWDPANLWQPRPIDPLAGSAQAPAIAEEESGA